MKMRTLLLLTSLSLFLAADVGGRPYEVTVKPSPTLPWLEVYHNGVLTSEWQPSDGAIYEFLETLLNDDFGRSNGRQSPAIQLAFLP